VHLDGWPWGLGSEPARTLIRPVLAVVAGICACLALVSLRGWLLLQRSDTRAAIQAVGDSIEGRTADDNRAQQAMDTMERDVRRMSWVFNPLIAAFTGVVVGLIARRWASGLAILAAAPYSVLFSLPSSAFWTGLGFLLFYLAAAAGGAWGASRLAGGCARDGNLP
jgi:hypothetical protein